MKLDHIQLAMPPGGEDAARAFFVGLLGMVEDQKPDPLSGRGGVWFRMDSVIVHLGVEKDFNAQKKAHPAFTVAGLDKLAADLSRAGNAIKWDEALSDRRRFYTEDPFGNRIEFMAEGDGFADR